jgi:hypothetical protein
MIHLHQLYISTSFNAIHKNYVRKNELLNRSSLTILWIVNKPLRFPCLTFSGSRNISYFYSSLTVTNNGLLISHLLACSQYFLSIFPSLFANT